MLLARFKTGLFGLLMGLMISACGFHLRGAYQLPDEMSSVYLGAQNLHSELLQDLRRILKANGSEIVNDASLAKTSIKIEKEKIIERVVSVDNRGRASEYEVKLEILYSVNVTAKDKSNAFKIKNRKLELIRDYIYDNEAVLGKSREKNVLIRDMQRDASRLIMLQIQAAHRKNIATQSAVVPHKISPE
ncbi:MAG: LPS assembly lipoprotein LptE [Gammaproteobacteria bacterium]|nr:LPS assembly lipoprotein LptE [Gammaproteobacteria bacterium]